MNMLDLLKSAQGGNGLENLARQFGLGQEQTESVLRGVLPAVSAGFKQRTQSQDGLAGILRSIQGTDHEDVFGDPAALQRDDVQSRGNDILGQIFGSKDVSRAVAAKTEQSSGVGSDLVKKMLPVVVSMVMGGMQKRASADSSVNGAVGGLLNGLLGSGGSARPNSGGGGLDQILAQVLGQQTRQPAPQPRSGGGGLGGILGGLLGGRKRRAPEPAPQRRAQPQPQGGGFDDLLGGIFGSAPKQRQSTGDPNLDAVIGMFDANGDGDVDMDVLRQLARRR